MAALKGDWLSMTESVVGDAINTVLMKKLFLLEFLHEE